MNTTNVLTEKNTVVYSAASLPGIRALSCTGRFQFKNHIHEGHVLWLNSAGGEHFSLNGSSGILEPGSISIIEPGVVHSNRGCEGSNRHLRSLYFEHSFFNFIEELATGAVSGRLQLPTATVKNDRCWLELLHLHEAIVNGQDRMAVEQVVLNLFPKLWDELTGVSRSSLDTDDSAASLLPVIDYMHANLGTPVELKDFAKLLSCTGYHVIRLFKKHVKMSPHAYLIQLRLENARSLLEKDCSIAEAAVRSGFSDQSHLTRKFKARYGITPGGYVRSLGV